MRVGLRAIHFAVGCAILAIGLFVEPFDDMTTCDEKGMAAWNASHRNTRESINDAAYPMLNCDGGYFDEWCTKQCTLADVFNFANFPGCRGKDADGELIASSPGRCFYQETVRVVAGKKNIHYAGVFMSSMQEAHVEEETNAFWQQWPNNVAFFERIRSGRKDVWVLRCDDEPYIGRTQKQEIACLKAWGFQARYAYSFNFAHYGELSLEPLCDPDAAYAEADENKGIPECDAEKKCSVCKYEKEGVEKVVAFGVDACTLPTLSTWGSLIKTAVQVGFDKVEDWRPNRADLIKQRQIACLGQWNVGITKIFST